MEVKTKDAEISQRKNEGCHYTMKGSVGVSVVGLT